MEEQDNILPPPAPDGEAARDPREVVEVYRRPLRSTAGRERVFLYRRPLPESMTPEPGGTALQEALDLIRSGAGERTPKKEEDPRKLRRRRRRSLRRFAACLCVLGILAGVSFAAEQPKEETRSFLPLPWETEEESGEITIPAGPTGSGARVAVELEHGRALTAQEVYRQVNPAVVLVMAQLEDGTAIGTGVIFTSDGYIVTNYHVLEGGEACRVVLVNGDQYEARYVGGDSYTDLAVLKIRGQDLPTAQFGSSDSLTVGDRVYAIGNPLGVELRGTLTDGIVSAIDRDVWVDNRTMTLIQTNAALNSGNSGGPLINEYGQVVGINVIKMVSEDDSVEGLGFSIPSASMERIVNDLLEWGEPQPEPVLGVSVSLVGELLEDGQVGLKVVDLTKGSAADKAGVRIGDYLLTANGEELRTSQDLLRVRRRCYLGDRLEVTLWRDGEILECTLFLETALEREEEEAPWYVD